MATDTLSRTLPALADSTRRGVLARPCQGTATVKELDPYGIPATKPFAQEVSG
jgi:hypothetical protein